MRGSVFRESTPKLLSNFQGLGGSLATYTSLDITPGTQRSPRLPLDQGPKHCIADEKNQEKGGSFHRVLCAARCSVKVPPSFYRIFKAGKSLMGQ